MVSGIGTDIIEIERIKKAATERFLKRLFSDAEICYIKDKNYAAQTIAGMFAAKEAFVKALGTGFGDMKFKEIEISHNERGKPYVVSDRLSDHFFCSLSISHCKAYAVATVVLERKA